MENYWDCASITLTESTKDHWLTKVTAGALREFNRGVRPDILSAKFDRPRGDQIDGTNRGPRSLVRWVDVFVNYLLPEDLSHRVTTHVCDQETQTKSGLCPDYWFCKARCGCSSMHRGKPECLVSAPNFSSFIHCRPESGGMK